MAVRQFSIVPSSPFPNRSLSGVLPLVALGFSGLLLLAAATGGGLVPAMGLLVAGLIAWAAWRWPVGAAVTLAALVPVHRFLMFLLFSLHGSTMLLRATQLWDDAFVAVLLIRVVHDAFLRRQAPQLRYLDLLILSFVGLTALYIFYPGTVPGTTLFGRLTGFRLDAYFLLAYFVGRGLTLKPHHVRWLLLALIPSGLAVAGVAVWQWVAPDQSTTFFQRLGFEEFLQAVGGTGDVVVRSRELASMEISRASSLLMSDLALSFYQTLTIPFAAALLFSLRKPAHQVAAGLFLLTMVGVVVLTVTRSAILASVVALVVVTLWGRGYAKMLVVTVGLAAVGLAFLLVSGLSGDSFQELLSLDEPSARAHVGAIERSLEIVKHEPLGRGLTTAGPLALRQDIEGGIINESWYLQLATEIGVLGAVLFSVILLTATAGAFISYLKVKDPWLRALTLGIAGAGVGFILVGVVLHVWEVTPLSMLFWLLVGIALRAPSLEKEWAETRSESS